MSTQQIYNEAAQIYVLNRDRFGEDPILIYLGEVLSVAPKPVADPAGSGRPGQGAGPLRKGSQESGGCRSLPFEARPPGAGTAETTSHPAAKAAPSTTKGGR